MEASSTDICSLLVCSRVEDCVLDRDVAAHGFAAADSSAYVVISIAWFYAVACYSCDIKASAAIDCFTAISVSFSVALDEKLALYCAVVAAADTCRVFSAVGFYRSCSSYLDPADAVA